MAVAIAVNDVIAATAPAIAARRGGPRYFSALIPETALVSGAKRTEVFAIVRRGGRLALKPL